ncbi:hypothetical protein BU16DRAFT_42464 [Lophium mytilinum]|uniref:LIM zinc-binding domain-containing protein n=1 Tax=Lophium mytilinum TaxID=390894 RepID=A0A6A6QPX8_9PEZI|nr:hypothetical protein BU16DRAFT_42464 [Lophium mytilinum]
MCEPLSILGGALTVASTAITLGQQTYEIVTGIQDAPEHIKRLATDLQGFYHVLGLLTHALNAQLKTAHPESLPLQMITNIQDLLEKCIDVFKDISRVVQPFLDNNGNALRNFTKSFKWEMTRKANVIHMQRTLSDYKLTLELAISSLNFINSSQTIDMVAHLQKDFRRLRRQIDSRDRATIAQKYPPSQQNAQELVEVNEETYSEPMRRFLARTASVISTTSTSTRATDIFSDDVSDVTAFTEYTEVPVNEFITPKPKDIDPVGYSAGSSPKLPEIREVDLGGLEKPLEDTSQRERSSEAAEKENLPQKPGTWKRFRNRVKRNGSSPSLGSLPEFESPSPVTPVSDHGLSPQGSFPFLGKPQDTKMTERSLSPGPFEETRRQTVGRKPVPIGAELTKSSSVPSIPLQGRETTLRAPEHVPHRSATTPISTPSSMSLQNKPYGLPRFSSPDNDAKMESSTSGRNDRDALLSSLRRGASKSISGEEDTRNKSSIDPSSPCKACSSPIGGEKHYTIRSHKWHLQCFRCNSCKVLLQSDTSTMFLVKDDFLVCNSCAYNCQSCDRRVDDHGANDEGLTGNYGRIQSMTQSPGQNLCPGLFFCHDCHKSIKNMRYARNRQGIFCLACHPQTMSEFERERREREREQMRAVPVLVE